MITTATRTARRAVLPRVLLVLAILLPTLGLADAAAAASGGGTGHQPPALVVGATGASRTSYVVFDLPDVGPGYHGDEPIELRNESSSTAAVTFTGFEFQGDGDAATADLRDVTTVTLSLGGTVIGRGGASSSTLQGSQVCLRPGAVQTLDSTVQIAQELGNRYQGGVLKLQYNFTASTAPGACGIEAPLTVPDTLPPTGESLDTFAVLVWAALGALALLLALWLVIGWRGRKDDEDAEEVRDGALD